MNDELQFANIKLDEQTMTKMIAYLVIQVSNLQKENEQEKQFIKDCGFENVQQLALDYIGIRQEKEDYKSRIEKAVEYIEEMQVWCIEFDNYGVITDGLLNILNGKE